MSLIGIALNMLLAGLLLAALGLGWRLNQRLKALRDSHDGFANAVRELNAAAERAEQGLADLRAAKTRPRASPTWTTPCACRLLRR